MVQRKKIVSMINFLIMLQIIIVSNQFTSSLEIGNVLYVSPSGSTYRSLMEAFQNCSSGDTIIIGSGNYSEKSALYKDNIKVIGNDSKTCIITSSEKFIPSIVSYGDNIIIQGIHFNNSGENKTSISINGNNSLINNCSFYLDGKYNRGITVDSPIDNLTVRESDFDIIGDLSHGLMIRKHLNRLNVINNSYYLFGIRSSGLYVNWSSRISINNNDFRIIAKGDDDRLNWNTGIILTNSNHIVINDNFFDLVETAGMSTSCGILSEPDSLALFDSRTDLLYKYKISNLSILDCQFRSYLRNFMIFIKHAKDIKLQNISGENIHDIFPIKVSQTYCAVLYSKNIIIYETSNLTFLFEGIRNVSVSNNSIMGILSTGRIKNELMNLSNNYFFYNLFTDRFIIDFGSIKNAIISQNIINNENGGGISLAGDNVQIINNNIRIEDPKGSYYAGIQTRNLLFGQEQNYSHNISIINNTIFVKGDNEIGSSYPRVCGIGIEDISGGYVADNEIVSIGKIAMGSWFKNILFTTVTNNTYKINGENGIGWNFGILKGWVVEQDWKESHYSKYTKNLLEVSGDGAKAIRMEYKVDNNVIENNDLKIHDGKNILFIDAKFDVDQSVHFSNVERWNTTGTEARLSENAKITTINADITNASVSEDSRLEVMQELSVGVKNYDRDPEPYADIRIRNREMEHSTPGYGGSQPYPGEKGYIGPFTVWDRIFDGSSTSTKYKTNMSVQLEGDIPWNTSVEMNIHRKTHYEFSVPNLTRPQIPTGLRADQIPGTQDLRISWDPVLENCWKYELEYTMGAEWTRLAIVDHPDTVFVHVGLDQDQWVSYRIRSYNGFLYSMFSSPIDAISGDITRPDAPSGFRIINISHDMIEVAWNKSLDKDVISSELWITRERSSEKLKEVSLPIDVLGHTFKDLGQDTDYDIYLMFRDDADLYSRMVAISVRTRNMTTRVDISVIYEPGSAWEGPAPGLKVSLVGTNYTHPSGTTDQYGICRFEDVHIPDSIMIVVDPPSVLAGEAGVKEGYLRIRSGPYTLSDPSYELDLDLVMEYYTRIIPEVKGKISGVVFYPLFGPLSGQAAVGSTVVLESSAGTEYRLESSSGGGFVLDNISLPVSLSVTAYPPSSSLDHYKESNTRNIILDTSAPSVSLNLTLLYKHPVVDPVYVSVIGYGPVGMVKSRSSPIWIEFSHPISGALDYDWIDIDPLFEGVGISLSGDRRTITVDHAGLHVGIEYKVSVSDRIPFEGAEGLNQSFVWRFSVESENDGGNGPIRDNNTLIFIIISAVLFLSLFIAFFIWLRRRSSVSNVSQIGDMTDIPNHHEE